MPEETKKRRIAIVGGGLSGLATAVHLHLSQPSLELSLFEAGDRTGGVIQTETVGQFILDHGADMFATNPPTALRLCERLGVADRLQLPKEAGRGAMIVRRGRLVPIPDGFVLMRATKRLPMLTTPLLSPLGKLRWLAERFASSGPGDDDISVAEFVTQRMGREVLDRLVAPLVAGIYTADVRRLSMQATMGTILQMQRQYGSLDKATAARRRSGEDSTERQSSGARYAQFRAFPGGMIELIQSLTNALPRGTIHLNHKATSLKRVDGNEEGTQWGVEINDTPIPEPFDDIVVATPPQSAARLLCDIAPVASQQLATIESASTAIVVLVVRRSDIRRPVKTFGFVVPEVENRQILACSFASEKFAGRAPEDHVIMRVFIGGSLQSELLQGDDNELRRIALRELAELIGLHGEPVMDRVVRWNNAMPQYHVGHLDRVEQIERSIDEIPSLWLVNNGLHGVGIAPVIRAAGDVADKMIE